MALIVSTQESPAKASPALRLRCWGDFALYGVAGSKTLNVRRRKTRALLAYLALHPDKPISRERLVGLLWGDRGEEQARGSLRQAVFEMRALEPAMRDTVVATRDHVTLTGAGLASDLGEIRDAASAGAFERMLCALPERHDRLFSNLDDIDTDFNEWLAIERTRQHDALLALLADASAHALAAGQPAAARRLAGRLRELDPNRPATSQAPIVSGPAAALSHAGNPTAPVTRATRSSARPLVAALVAVMLVAGILGIGAWRFGDGDRGTPASIAVLPFKTLSREGNAFFADGISEEILGRLAREEGLKVLGRTSAWSFRDRPFDAPTLGRKLGVDYLVEGSVRAAGAGVRINVALIRARDGAQLWSERFEGPLDDIFAMQDRIGDAVTTQLHGGEEAATARSVRPTRGSVYNLYLTARGLIRSREETSMATAIDLLRRAVRLDPRFAPAWASLGAAIHLREMTYDAAKDDGAKSNEAVDAIRRALALDPNLAEAHYALGLALAPSEAAKRHVETAVRLDPNNAEFWSLLAQLHARDGSFERSLAAWRRAVAIDPLWWQAFYTAAEMAWDMGHRAEASRYVRRVEYSGSALPYQAYMVRGDMAWRRNDFSGEYEQALAARNVAVVGRRFFAELGMGRALRAAGLHDRARPIWQHYKLDDKMWRMWRGEAPSREEVRLSSSDVARTWQQIPEIHFMLRTLVRARRFSEAASLFDRSFRSPEAFAGEPHVSHHEFLSNAPVIAIALARIGRRAEADQLLAMAEAAMLRRLRQDTVPLWYHASCAQIWAAKGDRSKALAALERATRLGWFYNKDLISFADIADEPAFASLRGSARFERIRALFRAHIERERRELLQII